MPVSEDGVAGDDPEAGLGQDPPAGHLGDPEDDVLDQVVPVLGVGFPAEALGNLEGLLPQVAVQGYAVAAFPVDPLAVDPGPLAGAELLAALGAPGRGLQDGYHVIPAFLSSSARATEIWWAANSSSPIVSSRRWTLARALRARRTLFLRLGSSAGWATSRWARAWESSSKVAPQTGHGVGLSFLAIA